MKRFTDRSVGAYFFDPPCIFQSSHINFRSVVVQLLCRHTDRHTDNGKNNMLHASKGGCCFYHCPCTAVNQLSGDSSKMHTRATADEPCAGFSTETRNFFHDSKPSLWTCVFCWSEMTAKSAWKSQVIPQKHRMVNQTCHDCFRHFMLQVGSLYRSTMARRLHWKYILHDTQVNSAWPSLYG